MGKLLKIENGKKHKIKIIAYLDLDGEDGKEKTVAEATCAIVEGMEYLGRKVLTKASTYPYMVERQCYELVSYRGSYWIAGDWSWCSNSEYTVPFIPMPSDLLSDHFEDISLYEKFIDYCDPENDDEYCLRLYYKKGEEKLLEEKMEALGGKRTCYIHEISQS